MVILSTKIQVPAAREGWIDRTSHFDRLDAAMNGGTTLIVAPAGFGKTTLLASWVRSRGHRVAWVSLDRLDNDPLRLWRHAIAALSDLASELGGDSSVALEGSQGTAIRDVVSLLINELDSVSMPSILILDDLHLISDQETLDSLAFLLKHRPASLRLVLASREDPPIPHSSLRASGELTEIGPHELRLTDSEAAEIVAHTLGGRISDADVRRLVSRVGGWAVGLRFAVLSLVDAEDPVSFIDRFSGTNRNVVEYLVEEVLDVSTPEIRGFLLCTSIVDSFNDDLANALVSTGVCEECATAGGRVVLDLVRRRGLLIEQSGEWFRYHDLFVDGLRFKLADLGSQASAGLHVAASQWYAEHGWFSEAFSHAESSGDRRLLADLLEHHAFDLLFESETRLALRYLESLDLEYARSRPKLAVVLAWTVALVHKDCDPAMVDHILRPAETAAGELDESLRRHVRGHAASIRAYLVQSPLRSGHDATRLVELARVANDLLGFCEVGIRSVNELGLGSTALERGDSDRARRHLHTARRLGLDGGNLYSAIYAVNGIASLHVCELRLGEARVEAETMIDTVEARFAARSRPMPALGALWIVLGRVALERDQCAEAEHLLMKGVESVRWTSELESLGFGLLALTCLYARNGDYEQAMTYSGRATALLPKVENADVRCSVAAWQIAHATAPNPNPHGFGPPNLPALPDWVSNLGLHPVARYVAALTVHKSRCVVLERLDRGDVATAETALRAAQTAALGTSERMRLDVLEAATCHAAGDRRAASAAFARVYRAAVESGAVLPILEIGRFAPELIQSYWPASDATDNRAAVLTRLSEMRDVGRPATPGRLRTLPDRRPAGQLSARELEVLELLSTGMSNREIGEALFISPYTVRAHTFNIYGKLDVHNRTEAVAVGRDVGLLAD